MKETKVMDKGKHNETEFGELDAVIASALADESFMPAPRPGFEARFEEYRAINKRRRMFAAFRWSSFAKAAAALVVLLGAGAYLAMRGQGGAEKEQLAVPQIAAAAEQKAQVAPKEEPSTVQPKPDSAADGEAVNGNSAKVVAGVVRGIIPSSPMGRMAGMLLGRAANAYAKKSS